MLNNNDNVNEQTYMKIIDKLKQVCPEVKNIDHNELIQQLIHDDKKKPLNIKEPLYTKIIYKNNGYYIDKYNNVFDRECNLVGVAYFEKDNINIVLSNELDEQIKKAEKQIEHAEQFSKALNS